MKSINYLEITLYICIYTSYLSCFQVTVSTCYKAQPPFSTRSWMTPFKHELPTSSTLHTSKSPAILKCLCIPQLKRFSPACNLSTFCGPSVTYLYNSGSNRGGFTTIPHFTVSNKGQHFFTQKRHFSTDPIYNFFSIDFLPIKISHDLFVNIYTFTGLPWWASIALTTVLLRSCITLPLAVYSNYILARVENLQPEIRKLSHRLKIETAKAIREFGWSMEHARKRYNYSVSLENIFSFFDYTIQPFNLTPLGPGHCQTTNK